jgi:hypothetical protein
MDMSMARRLKALEDENTELNRILADAMSDLVTRKDLVEKDWRCPQRIDRLGRQRLLAQPGQGRPSTCEGFLCHTHGLGAVRPEA